ncbi:MAG: amino acid ABC transporter ATP-binding protein, partial [Clostridia bacterium]
AGGAFDLPLGMLFMDDGVVVEEGTPEAIFTSPKNKRTQDFLGKLL